MSLHLSALLQGFFVGFGLILAIGAQNAFVLRQGLRGEHVALVCFTCAFSDAVLIAVGVAGFGAIVATLPWIDPVFRIGGVLFLTVYGIRAWISAWRGNAVGLEASGSSATSWRNALLTCLAFTWLNPHVYLDTVVLLGSVSSGFEGRRVAFAGGAVIASFTFFYLLGYGAKLVRPVFARPVAWRYLDAFIGLLMLLIALSLLRGL